MEGHDEVRIFVRDACEGREHARLHAQLLAQFAQQRLFLRLPRLDLAAHKFVFVRDVRIAALPAPGGEHLPLPHDDGADDLQMLFHTNLPRNSPQRHFR